MIEMKGALRDKRHTNQLQYMHWVKHIKWKNINSYKKEEENRKSKADKKK